MMRYLWSEPACPTQGLRGAREPGRGAGWLGGCFVIISLAGEAGGGVMLLLPVTPMLC